MRLKAIRILIVIMILLPIMAFISSTSSGSGAPLPVTSPGYYNFTTMPAGQFPENTSWIGFRNTTLNTQSDMITGNAAPVSGFNINTSAPLSSPEYFYANLNGTANESIKITYSWSDSYNLLTTIDNIEMMQGGKNIIRYFFGPGDVKDGIYSQYIYGKALQNIGRDPAVDSFQTVELSWNRLQPGIIFFSTESGYNSTGNFPLSIQVNATVQPGNISLMFGGSNCSITLDEIYVTNHNEGFSLLPSRNYTYEVQQSGNITTNLGNATDPVLDPGLNDVLFIAASSNMSISYWNYADNTAGKLAQLQPLHEGIFLSTVSGNEEYVAYANSTEIHMITINLTDLSILTSAAQGYFPHFTGISWFSGNFVMISRFSLVAANFTSGISRSYNISLGINSSVVAVDQSHGNLTGIDLNLSSGYAVQFNLNKTLGMSEAREKTFLGKVADTGLAWETDGVSGILMNSTSTPSYSFSVNPDNYSQMLMISGGIDTWSDLGGIAVRTLSEQMEFLTPDAIIVSNIFLQNVTSAYLDFNASAGALAAGSDIYIFYSNSEPLSHQGILMKLDPAGIITQNSTVRYSVVSNLTYSLNVTLNGVPLPAGNGNITIDIWDFPTGIYRLTATATNIAGYSSSMYEYISIDSQRPVISVHPGNGTYIAQSQGFSINITGASGVGNTTVQWNDGTFRTQDLSFGLFVSSSPGKLVLWVNFTDDFGIVHSRWFNYTTISSISDGTSIGITNGTFYSHSNLTVHWGETGNVSYYCLNVHGAGRNYSYKVYRNWTVLSLANGKFDLSLNATLLDGETVFLGSRNFGIETFHPLLNVNTSDARLLSFYGNSNNDTVEISVSSNVTSQISGSLIYGGAVLREWDVLGKNWSTVLDRNSDIFHFNGTYDMDIEAAGMSGLISYHNISWSVNNSIPALPFFQRHVVYTNSTVFPFSYVGNRNVSITANISGPASWELQPAGGGRITLPEGNSSYNVTFCVRSLWNNSANETIIVMSYEEPPEINTKISRMNLSDTNTTSLAFSVEDYVPAYVKVEMSNSTMLYSGDAVRGNVTIYFHSDGNYSVTVTAIDLCGNMNSTTVMGINVTYYPQITGIGIAYSIISGFAEFRPVVHGTDLQNLKYTWIVSGHTYAGSSLKLFLLPGYHAVKLEVEFNGQSHATSSTLFTMGFIPEVLAAAIPLSLIAYRRIAYDADDDSAAKLILKMKNRSIREIMKEGKIGKIRKKTMESALKRLAESGKILILSDPDGQRYAMDPSVARR